MLPTSDEALRETLQEALADASRASGEVLICGGGIGGLAASIALARRNISSHVVERRASFSEEGAGIQIGPNGTRILRSLGVAEALRPHVGVPQWLVVHDAQAGGELGRMPMNVDMAARFGAPYWVAHREDLHAALLMQARAEPRIRLTLGADVAVAATADNAAGIALRDGAVLTAPVVVGADGLRSRLRAETGHPGRLAWVGKSALRSVVPAGDTPAPLCDGNTHIWLSPDAHVVHYPVRGGAEMALVAIVRDTFSGEGWSHETELRPYLAPLRFCPRLRTLLEAPASWRKWALVTMADPPPMAHGRIALIGDAAHPVLPFLAQGGVLALEDAVALAAVLSSGERDAVEALREFARQREPRKSRVAAASLRNGRIYHLRGLPRQARNVAMRVLPTRRLMARYDWIYGWTLAAK
jgi:salicylate hydroxylase